MGTRRTFAGTIPIILALLVSTAPMSAYASSPDSTDSPCIITSIANNVSKTSGCIGISSDDYINLADNGSIDCYVKADSQSDYNAKAHGNGCRQAGINVDNPLNALKPEDTHSPDDSSSRSSEDDSQRNADKKSTSNDANNHQKTDKKNTDPLPSDSNDSSNKKPAVNNDGKKNRKASHYSLQGSPSESDAAIMLALYAMYSMMFA